MTDCPIKVTQQPLADGSTNLVAKCSDCGAENRVNRSSEHRQARIHLRCRKTRKTVTARVEIDGS